MITGLPQSNSYQPRPRNNATLYQKHLNFESIVLLLCKYFQTVIAIYPEIVYPEEVAL